MNHHTFSYLPTQRRVRCGVDPLASGTPGARYTTSADGVESVRSPIRVTPSALPALVYAIIYSIEFQAPLGPRSLPLKLHKESASSSSLSFRHLRSVEAVNGATSTVLGALSSFLGRSSNSTTHTSEAALSAVSVELQQQAAARQRQREQPLVVPVTQVIHKLDGVHLVVRQVHCSTVEQAKEKALREVHEIVIRHRERQEQMAACANKDMLPQSPCSLRSPQSRYHNHHYPQPLHHSQQPSQTQQQTSIPNSDAASLMRMMSTHYRSFGQQILPAALTRPGSASMQHPCRTTAQRTSNTCHTPTVIDVDKSSNVSSSCFARAPSSFRANGSGVTAEAGGVAVAPPMAVCSRCAVMPFPTNSVDSSHSCSSVLVDNSGANSINNNNSNYSARNSSCDGSARMNSMSAPSATLSMLKLRPGEIGLELWVRLLSREERWRMSYDRPLVEWSFPIIRTKDEDAILYLGTPSSTQSKPCTHEWRSHSANMGGLDGCAAYFSAQDELTASSTLVQDGGSAPQSDFIFVNDASQVNDVLHFILKTFYESINLETFTDFTSGELVFDAHVTERRSFYTP